MSTLIIIGASGHGKVVVDIAKRCGYDDIVFLDDDPEKKECGGYRVIGKTAAADAIEGDLFVAVGSSEIRKRCMEQYPGRCFPILIHPNATVADSVEIGPGTVVMAGVVINPYAVVGKGCIVNTCSSIDHDSVVGDYCHVSVGAHLCGTVNVADKTWIGAGVTVNNNINISVSCMIGAGSLVVKDITEPGIYIGVPAMRKDG